MKKLVAAALIAATGSAFAQDGLVVGVDDSTVPVFVYQNGAWNELFDLSTGTPNEAWGLAAVNSEQRIYFNNGSQLGYWSQSTGIVDVGAISIDGTTSTMVGLTYDPVNDVLLGTRNIGGDGSTTAEGLYSIDRSTGAASLILDYTAADFDYGGIGLDAVTGRLFGVNDDSTPQRGLFEIDPGSGISTFIADYPAGETDIDGLAVYDNIAYLVTDQPGSFYAIDVNNPGAGFTAFDGPFTSSEIFSGATVAEWLIPTPSSAAVLGLAGLAAARRRR